MYVYAIYDVCSMVLHMYVRMYTTTYCLAKTLHVDSQSIYVMKQAMDNNP